MKSKCILMFLIVFYNQSFSQRFIIQPEKLSNQNKTDNFTYIAKSAGHYTPEQWRAIIDSTWNDGLDTADKLEIFDVAWDLVNTEYACFQNLDIDWQGLKDLYRPEIAAGVSKGRFVSIMNHLALRLQETHTVIDEEEVNYDTPLDAGVPLFSIFAHANNIHFGASLTPLPDSTLLVYKVLPDHPLGLIPGDIILGYDGILWKDLYKELLEIEMPYHADHFPYSTESAMDHLYLSAAGNNWHLYDTLDVIPYNGTDTLHLPTSLLTGLTGTIWGNEQLPVAGVPYWPEEGSNITGKNWFSLGDYVHYGIVDGTNIGYIYVTALQPVWQQDLAEQFREAVDSLWHTDGLILDIRLNYGGPISSSNQALARLFNSRVNTVSFDMRCGDANDHFQMCPHAIGAEDMLIPGDVSSLYQSPIAVLTGPACTDGGDQLALRMKLHPMSRLFGKPTGGGFSTWPGDLSWLAQDWYISYPTGNAYRVNQPGTYLSHTGLAVDEAIWLEKDDVANGEDTVVKTALQWIQNLTYAHDVTIDKSFIEAGDTLLITTVLKNPNLHDVSIKSSIYNTDSSLTDSVELFDDGLHSDGAADDNLWANTYELSPVEQNYILSITAYDITDKAQRTLPAVKRFTSNGPVVMAEVPYTAYIANGDTGRQYINPALKNTGEATIFNLSMEIDSNDPRIAEIIHNRIFLGDLMAGETVTSDHANFLTFDFAEGIDPLSTIGNPIQFEVAIYSNDYPFWKDSFAFETIVTGVGEEGVNDLPAEFYLSQNYPNPFNPITHIEYHISNIEYVDLSIYNQLGQKVATLVNKRQTAGNYRVRWNATGFASGIYYYKIVAGDYQKINKMLLVK